MSFIQISSTYFHISYLIQTIRLPKITALISGQGRAHDFPGMPFTNRGRRF
jgi:hypothetical protein